MTNFKPETGVPQGGAHPIMRANWKMEKYESEERTFGDGPTARKSMSIKFSFMLNGPPLESREPWNFPIAQITIPYANPQTSRGEDRWSVWTASGRRIFGGQFNIDDLVGRDQQWAQLPGKVRQPWANLSEEDQEELRGKEREKFPADADPEKVNEAVAALEKGWYAVESPCWQIVSVEGVTPANGTNGATASGTTGASGDDLMDYMAGAAEGRKEDEFYIALVGDQKVTAQPSIVGMITNRLLVDSLISTGKITRDPDGTLHKSG